MRILIPEDEIRQPRGRGRAEIARAYAASRSPSSAC